MLFLIVDKKFLEGICHLITLHPSANLPLAYGNKEFQYTVFE